MVEKEKPTAAFIISLISGIFIILGGFATIVMMGTWGWMMGRMIHGWFMPRIFVWIGFFGLISGIIVVISALMLNFKPENHVAWGTLILLFSVLSIFGGAGGFAVGLILGVIGGILALTWKPKQ
ncbi:MAG: DUF6114 domain-containing protein [Candidatus Bathyarchaeia archaeon]